MRRLTLAALVLGLLATFAPHSALAPLSALAPSDTQPPARTEPTLHLTAPEAFGAPATATGTAPYKFSVLVAGKPVRWNPCQTIYWKYNPSGGPKGGYDVITSAIKRVAYLTGTRWKYVSSTRTEPTSKWLPSSTSSIRPLLIGWSDASQSDLLRGQAKSVLAVARTAYFQVAIDGANVAATKSAVIALDRTDRMPLYGAVSWRATVLHELGHVMGLDHVGSRSQLMYPVLQRDLKTLMAGDQAGLRKLGRESGCVNLGF
jgi:hypothetical protein